MTADEIISAARAAIGIPFKHQGRSTAGIDCVGLPLFIAAKLGVKNVIDVVGYSRRPSGGKLEKTFDAHVESGVLIRVGIRDMRAGDFLMMRFRGEPQHIAVYTGENIIHAYEAVGKVCEHHLDDLWASRIVRVYRLAEVEL